jgi:hypothetical protein
VVAGDGAAHEDDREQARRGLEQPQGDVVGEPGGGDAGADDQGGEEGAAEELGRQASGQRDGHGGADVTRLDR